MAIWQFSMHLVPREELLEITPNLHAAVPGNAWDEKVWWRASQPPHDLPERLAAVLPEITSGDFESRVWGPPESDTVAVSYFGRTTAGHVHELWARLDLRELRDDVIAALVAIGVVCDGWWVTGNSDRRLPVGQSREAILSAIQRSDSAHFLRTPRAYLNALPNPEQKAPDALRNTDSHRGPTGLPDECEQPDD